MTHDRTRRVALMVVMVAAVSSGPRVRAGSDPDAFETEVRPVLVEHCQKCHGAEKAKAGFRVDSRAAMVEGGDSGPAIVAGDLGSSLLIQAIRHDGDLKMPPDHKLAPGQIAAIERWVAAGALWPADPTGPATRRDRGADHWAYRPVGNPQPPAPREPAWCRTPVDAFIQARLDAAGLTPAPRADRAQLIRRVTYDLTGLPPRPEAVRAFVADPDPHAYEALVERLLASEQYGVQWARHWLDVARYADTKGYVYAREERGLVQAPTYRDWVVNAFNADLPYDRFLLLQIAADQVDPDHPGAMAAMGFLTVGRRFLGVTPDIIDDRIDVLTRGTMGLTVACARCHDHKYDPIPMADYYSLYGVFQNGTERQVRVGQQEPRDEGFEAELAKRQKKLRQGMDAARAEASARARTRVADYLLAQQDLSKIPREGFDVVIGKDDLNPSFVRRWHAFLAAPATRNDPVFRPWHRFAALADAEFTAKSQAVTDDLLQDGASPLPPPVARAFATVPKSIREVAERYAKLFSDADSPGLAQVLTAERGPCSVPNEPIVTTEGFFDSTTVVELWKLQGEVDRWLIQSPQAPPYAVALVDRAEIREPRIFRRGNSANPGDEVPRRFLKVLARSDRRPFQHGSGRRELAEAIVDPTNPLTARVWVNRIWMHHFGAGLVRTPSDFGVRAEPPSHPELLDWLAHELVASGWSTKAIHRRIVLSATYQQQSQGPTDPVARELAERVDPENRLLSRMPRHRLTFEEARDTWLDVAGEIDLRLGGRPAELFPAGTTNPRRTLFGTVDRQFLPSVFRSFDFANPDLHIPTRTETTVPQQALFALNHPFLADRARALAARVRSHDPAETVRLLYQATYQRATTDQELRASLDFLAASASDPAETVRPETQCWQYGYVAVDPRSGPTGPLQPLPHFNGSAWGGGSQWPDAQLGWVRLTAEGGHPGNDLGHAAIRRWTAPRRCRVAVRSSLTHSEATGDGVRVWVVAGRGGVLRSASVHNRTVDLDVPALDVEAGDTIDFVVDIGGGLNSDQHLWHVAIAEQGDPARATTWDSSRDFAGPAPRILGPIEQLAQVLLMSNELMFVD